MKPKTLIVLLIVAVVLGGVAVLTRRSDNTLSDMIGKRVLGDLPLNDIAAVTITTPDGSTRLARTGDVWVSTNDFNYPADFGRIKAAILKVADLKIGQVTDLEDSDKVALKMVAPVDSPDGGTLVELEDASGTTLATLLIGATRQRSSGDTPNRFAGYPDGQYVSPDKGETVYLTAETLYEFTQASGWLDKQLVSVPATDVASIRIDGPQREPLALSVPAGNSDLSLEGLNKDEELDPAKINTLKSALSYLRFESVADPALTDDALGFTQPDTFTLTTKKGAVYTVEIGNQVADSENRYARIRVALPPPPEAKASAPETEMTDDEQKAADAAKAQQAEARAQLEKSVADLNATLSPWTYVLASYKTDAMRSTRNDIVKPKTVEEPPQNDKEEE